MSKKPATYDGRKVLSRVSGLSQGQVSEIWEAVKANIKALDECRGPHEFVNATPTDLRSKYVCSKCGGKVSRSDYRWYDWGLKHGRENSDAD